MTLYSTNNCNLYFIIKTLGLSRNGTQWPSTKTGRPKAARFQFYVSKTDYSATRSFLTAMYVALLMRT